MTRSRAGRADVSPGHGDLTSSSAGRERGGDTQPDEERMNGADSNPFMNHRDTETQRSDRPGDIRPIPEKDGPTGPPSLLRLLVSLCVSGVKKIRAGRDTGPGRMAFGN